jgi:hypothetical protein
MIHITITADRVEVHKDRILALIEATRDMAIEGRSWIGHRDRQT